jgi:acyl dehydratase
MTDPVNGTSPSVTDGSPVTVGERFARRVTFDAESIRAFATLCGDANPLHHDDAAALRSPFGTLIASGPQTASLMMGLNATFFCARFDALGLDFRFRFVKAVPAGATLTLEWTISASVPKPSLQGHIVSVEGRAVDDAGVVFVSATGDNLVRQPVQRSVDAAGVGGS